MKSLCFRAPQSNKSFNWWKNVTETATNRPKSTHGHLETSLDHSFILKNKMASVDLIQFKRDEMIWTELCWVRKKRAI